MQAACVRLAASSGRHVCIYIICSAGEQSDQRREPDLVAESHKSDITGCELDATYPDIVLNVADALGFHWPLTFMETGGHVIARACSGIGSMLARGWQIPVTNLFAANNSRYQ